MSRTGAVLGQVRGLLAAQETDLLTDRELLRRFAERSDEAAFAALVRRHGPMVLHVCRGVLRTAPDADDVFQAVFLALAWRAGAAGWRDSVAGWLHTVARRLALRARGERALRSEREAGAGARPPADPLDLVSGRELGAALDEEIGRLPDRCRAPLVLCCLEAVTRDEAARQLGWSLATLKRRLERGRALLRQRLERRGFSVPAALGAATLAVRADAAVSARAVQAAVDGAASPAGASARVLALAGEMSHGLSAVRLKSVFAAAALLCLVGVGVGLLPADPPDPTTPPAKAARPPAAPTPTREVASRADQFGDPLPPGALARIGSVRWRLGPGGVQAVGFPPDGKTMVTANAAGDATVWDVATGRVVREVGLGPDERSELRPARVAAALSADGSTLACLAKDETVCLVELASGKIRRRFRPEKTARELALSGNGRLLLARAGNTLQFWDAVGGERLVGVPLADQGEPASQGDRPARVAVTPDGKTFAWVEGAKGHTVHVCNTATLEERIRLRMDQGWNPRLVLSPAGDRLLSSSDDGQTQLWDLKTGKVLHTFPSSRYASTVAAFAPDGGSLALITPALGLRLYEAASGKEVWHRLKGAWTSTTPDLLAFAADGKSLVLVRAGFEHILFRHDAATGDLLPSPNERAECFAQCAFSPDGGTLYTLHGKGSLSAWDAGTGRPARPPRALGGAAALSPDGRLAAVCVKGAVHVVATGPGRDAVDFAADVNGYDVPIFSTDSRTVALLEKAGESSFFTFREAATGRLRAWTDTFKQLVAATAYSPDGRHLAGQLYVPYSSALDVEPRVHLWDAATGRPWRSLETGDCFTGILYSPDGKTLVTFGKDFKAHFFEVSTGRIRLEVGPFRLHPSPLAFSPDGRLLAQGTGYDACVRLWDAFRGTPAGRIEGHRGAVAGFAFSPDGRRLATASNDTTALVWDLTAFGRTKRPPAPKRAAGELAALWDDLCGHDAGKAYRAVGTLADAADQAVPLLRDRVRPAAPADLRRLSALLAALDADRFEERERVEREIAALGDQAEPDLRRALAGALSAEAGARVRRVLETIPSPELIAALRAVEVLEHAATPEARRLLDDLAAGAPEACLTREATASRDRLARRAGRGP